MRCFVLPPSPNLRIDEHPTDHQLCLKVLEHQPPPRPFAHSNSKTSTDLQQSRPRLPCDPDSTRLGHHVTVITGINVERHSRPHHQSPVTRDPNPPESGPLHEDDRRDLSAEHTEVVILTRPSRCIDLSLGLVSSSRRPGASCSQVWYVRRASYPPPLCTELSYVPTEIRLSHGAFPAPDCNCM